MGKCFSVLLEDILLYAFYYSSLPEEYKIHKTKGDLI